MIKRFKRQRDTRFFYRVNERITSPQLRVLDSLGKQIGVMQRFEALRQAKIEGLDLVEIAPNAHPSVAKIIDFKKFLYQQAKKRQEERKRAKVAETKEVRLGPFMDEHDLSVSIRRAQEFLGNGDKVRFVIRFMGRQITHPEFGREVLNKAIAEVANVSKIEREPHLEGRQLTAVLSPERKRRSAKNQNQKVAA